MRSVGKIAHRPGKSYFGASGVWVIEAEPHVMMRLKRLFPRVRGERTGAVLVGDTPEIARDHIRRLAEQVLAKRQRVPA